jgi:hypothetical protein
LSCRLLPCTPGPQWGTHCRSRWPLMGWWGGCLCSLLLCSHLYKLLVEGKGHWLQSCLLPGY